MSMPDIPNIDAEITIGREDTITLLLASIAFEELGQAHLINAEAEKLQYILGTLEGSAAPAAPTIEELLEANQNVAQMLRIVIKNQMLLQFKLEDAIDLAAQS